MSGFPYLAYSTNCFNDCSALNRIFIESRGLLRARVGRFGGFLGVCGFNRFGNGAGVSSIGFDITIEAVHGKGGQDAEE